MKKKTKNTHISKTSLQNFHQEKMFLWKRISRLINLIKEKNSREKPKKNNKS